MNRRYFLKFIPLIPIAIGLVKLPKPVLSTVEGPAESVTKLEGMESIMARIKAMKELMERTGTVPAPANGHSYSDEEMEVMMPFTRWWVKEKLLNNSKFITVRQG